MTKKSRPFQLLQDEVKKEKISFFICKQFLPQFSSTVLVHVGQSEPQRSFAAIP